MPHYRLCTLTLVILASSPALMAQQTPLASTGSWAHVQALPGQTKVHITTDHGGRTCHIFAVSDDSLTCAKSGNTAGTVVQRSEIKHIKLAHAIRSTFVGAGIGGGIGAVSGAIAGRTRPCPAGQGLCLSGIGIGAGGVAAIFGIAGGLVGSVIGGTTDMARGSAIYFRP